VQTPTGEDHVPYYESLRQASEQVGRYLQPGTLVIIESTVAPGTTQHVVQPILERASGLKGAEEQGSKGAGGQRRVHLCTSDNR
jgi:UDP-N-acetyl-D-mannosaminuronate dehydrogenase